MRTLGEDGAFAHALNGGPWRCSACGTLWNDPGGVSAEWGELICREPAGCRARRAYGAWLDRLVVRRPA